MNPFDSKTHNSLVPHTNTSLTATNPRDRVFARMVCEALEVARRQAAQAKKTRFKIGNFELCGPDYRQIRRWAASLDWTPEEVLGKLAEIDSTFTENYGEFRSRPILHSVSLGCNSLHIANGSITSLVWDGELMPLRRFEWEPGLEIKSLRILKHLPEWPACQQLPSLRTLIVAGTQLTELDLSPVPGLTILDCGANRLTELDLSPVPELTALSCESNQLTALDLSPVPRLTSLYCYYNLLTELDYSHVRLRCLESDDECFHAS